MARLAILLGLVTLAGCGTSITYVPMNPPPRSLSARDPQTVQMFVSGRPERPFVDVGLIEAQQESEVSTDDEAAVLQKMRVEAGARGCDALMITGSNDRTVVSGTSPGHIGSRTLRGYRGSCVVFTGPPAGASQPAAAPSPSAASLQRGPMR